MTLADIAGDRIDEMMRRRAEADLTAAKERRERIATVIFAAYRANQGYWWNGEIAAASSVKDADALIAELDKEVGA